MVNIKYVRISNSWLTAKPPGMVAVFVGGTSGIGQGTLKQLAKYATAPKVYVVGRSKSSAAPLLRELESMNAKGAFIFMETEISLIRNVDTVCREIRQNEKKVDLIFLSSGFLSLQGRQETSEGIDTYSSVSYYARLRVVYDLLPLLSASVHPRVVAVLAGGKERAIDINNLELRNGYTAIKAVNTATTQTTLAFEELTKSYPMITFCHVYPGFVDTGALNTFMGTFKGIWAVPATLATWTVIPVLNMFGRTAEEAGEWCLFVATSAKYPPAEPNDPEELGVAMPDGVAIAKSSVSDDKCNGVYRLDNYGESVQNECDSILAGYRSDGKTIWEETLAVWETALKRGEGES
ncbi:hypothetical protein V1506DRAFT_165770 [Lipomyces tetrasporus]